MYQDTHKIEIEIHHSATVSNECNGAVRCTYTRHELQINHINTNRCCHTVDAWFLLRIFLFCLEQC